MTLYSRPQLVVLLLVVVVAGVGLGVGQWRRAYPDLADRLERLDRSPATVGELGPAADLVAEPPGARVEPRSRARARDDAAGAAAVRSRADGAGAEREERADERARRGVRPKAAELAQPVDVNRANEEELRALPGVGATLAARIVEARERDGPFASLDDLRRVRGLGRAKLEKLAIVIGVSP